MNISDTKRFILATTRVSSIPKRTRRRPTKAKRSVAATRFPSGANRCGIHKNESTTSIFQYNPYGKLGHASRIANFIG